MNLYESLWETVSERERERDWWACTLGYILSVKNNLKEQHGGQRESPWFLPYSETYVFSTHFLLTHHHSSPLFNAYKAPKSFIFRMEDLLQFRVSLCLSVAKFLELPQYKFLRNASKYIPLQHRARKRSRWCAVVLSVLPAWLRHCSSHAQMACSKVIEEKGTRGATLSTHYHLNELAILEYSSFCGFLRKLGKSG